MTDSKRRIRDDPPDPHGADPALHRGDEAVRDRQAAQPVDLQGQPADQAGARARHGQDHDREPVPAAGRCRAQADSKRPGSRKVVVTPSVPGNPDTNLQRGRPRRRQRAAGDDPRRRRDRDHRREGGERRRREPRAGPHVRRHRGAVDRAACRASTTPTSTTWPRSSPTSSAARPMLLHAPLFAESREQRDTLMEVGSIRQVFDLARRAQVALVGIGSICAPEAPATTTWCRRPNGERELLLERRRRRRVPRPPHPRRRIGGGLSAQLAARGAQSGRAVDVPEHDRRGGRAGEGAADSRRARRWPDQFARSSTRKRRRRCSSRSEQAGHVA